MFLFGKCFCEAVELVKLERRALSGRGAAFYLCKRWMVFSCILYAFSKAVVRNGAVFSARFIVISLEIDIPKLLKLVNRFQIFVHCCVDNAISKLE